jgi:hypothetical protein
VLISLHRDIIPGALDSDRFAGGVYVCAGGMMRTFARSVGRNRSPRLHIPQRSDELTATWFTDVLSSGATVVGVRAEEVGADVGFMGEVHRCHLFWDRPDDANLPASVIVKLPTQVDENFALGDALQSYEREIVVYRTLRSSLGLPMPEFLYGAMDPDPAPWLERPVVFLLDHLPLRAANWLIAVFLRHSGRSKRRYVLVIEDIADARPPVQLAGGSLDDAHRALGVLARFHATNWMRTDAIESYARIWPLDRAMRIPQAGYVRNRDRFVERLGAVDGDEVVARLDDIQERIPDICSSLAAAPWTLLHGDFRLDNLLFRPEGEIVVLDLQGLASGRAAFDVAYFITSALTAEHRDAEASLLRSYHDALVDAGVTTYPWDELVHDCDLSKELLVHRWVGAADVLDTSMTDGDLMLDVMQQRILDWLI